MKFFLNVLAFVSFLQAILENKKIYNRCINNTAAHILLQEYPYKDLKALAFRAKIFSQSNRIEDLILQSIGLTTDIEPIGISIKINLNVLKNYPLN